MFASISLTSLSLLFLGAGAALTQSSEPHRNRYTSEPAISSRELAYLERTPPAAESRRVAGRELEGAPRGGPIAGRVGALPNDAAVGVLYAPGSTGFRWPTVAGYDEGSGTGQAASTRPGDYRAGSGSRFRKQHRSTGCYVYYDADRVIQLVDTDGFGRPFEMEVYEQASGGPGRAYDVVPGDRARETGSIGLEGLRYRGEFDPR